MTTSTLLLLAVAFMTCGDNGARLFLLLLPLLLIPPLPINTMH